VIGAIAATLLIKEGRETDVEPLDVRGFALAAVALVGLVAGFEILGRGSLPRSVAAVLLGFGGAAGILYVMHARRHPHPILDLRFLAIPTFRTAVMGGIFFRVATGALPFLLPLLMQLGFGLSPLVSGLITFASALGSLTMRIVSVPIVRFFGFRTVLIGNLAICAVFFFAYGLFTPRTPIALIFVALLAGGFFRSLQLTALNTLGYADIALPRMSRASSFASMAQQLSMSIGVGIGASVLHIVLSLRGGEALAAEDFLPAFFAVGAFSLLSIVAFLPLAADAGAEVSGKRPTRPREIGVEPSAGPGAH
jgi:hypothetical protein